MPSFFEGEGLSFWFMVEDGGGGWFLLVAVVPVRWRTFLFFCHTCGAIKGGPPVQSGFWFRSDKKNYIKKFE